MAGIGKNIYLLPGGDEGSGSDFICISAAVPHLDILKTASKIKSHIFQHFLTYQTYTFAHSSKKVHVRRWFCAKMWHFGCISNVKEQKDATLKTQIFQEAQKTKPKCKRQIHLETRGEFQKILKFV